jgi:hypothetical protein
MKEFGKPKSCDCQELATFPQDKTALILQDNGSEGEAAILIASIERTRDAKRLRNEETNIAT